MNFRQLMNGLQQAARRTAENVSRVLQGQRPGSVTGARTQPAPASPQELGDAARKTFERIDQLPGFPKNAQQLRGFQGVWERALAEEIQQQRAQQRRWEELRRLGLPGGGGGLPGGGGSGGGQPGAPGAPAAPGGMPGVMPDGGADTGGGGTARWIGPELDQDQLDLLHGTMHDVVSSNVHSIGMQASQPGARTGTLLIRFLGTRPGGRRGGKGPTYAYRDVPVELFREFRTAASKGKFVWDYVRVRGTVSGHRFPYELVGVINGYVPRQAGLKRGQPGEYFLRRTWTGYKVNRQTGQLEKVTLQSQLPERRVSARGPNPGRGPGLDSLRFGR